MGGGANPDLGSLVKVSSSRTTVNKYYYINDVLTPVLLPEANGLNLNGDWIFQQDGPGATAHSVNATHSWL